MVDRALAVAGGARFHAAPADPRKLRPSNKTRESLGTMHVLMEVAMPAVTAGKRWRSVAARVPLLLKRDVSWTLSVTTRRARLSSVSRCRYLLPPPLVAHDRHDVGNAAPGILDSAARRQSGGEHTNDHCLVGVLITVVVFVAHTLRQGRRDRPT